ncbi:aminodeoxychorismate/anthranilate synthase component II [Aliikangiella marina]|uniref:Aminodeoxychorismate/anthranilate synthase component II n=2 Tax=Aliikangiella marina TaxID=1712262 RepID=A0A545TA83_9GAMM|nr:aminodeoxychorismate/anthranilate synthase component II [Aliikangiella marina]
MLDNYDSFTFNLVHYLQQLEIEVVVRRNDEVSISEIEAISPSHIVISPGPCDPDKAGISLKVIEHFHQVLPILGVCLGHQAIGQVFGGQVVKAERVMHGKTSPIYHANQGVFVGLPQGFAATRYHSLVIDKANFPDCLTVTAWTQKTNGDVSHIMGIKHKDFPIEGVQFHPESVLSEHGMTLLKRFLSIK